MSAGAPWSVKGIDPKAREIAKDLARRSGMTLGEWLNQMILEGDSEEDAVVTPLARRTPPWSGPDRRGRTRRMDDAYGVPPELEQVPHGDLDRVASALESLSARIEAAENRSTLAIGGVNQAVAGLLSRLETGERDQSATSARVEHVAEDLRDEQGRMLDRIREIERNESGQRSVEALRALETALGKIANQVYEGDARTRAALLETREDVQGLGRRVDRVEAQGAAADASALVDDVVARIAERLEQAEARTSGAIRALESAFGHLDMRLQTAESRIDAAESEEIGLEKLAADLSERVDQVRVDLAASLEAAADGRMVEIDRAMADLAGHVRAAETRSAEAIERMGHEVVRIAQNLNRRVTGAEQAQAQAVVRAQGEMARMAQAVENRLRKSDDSHAQALERLGTEIGRISERLNERIAHSERRASVATDDMGERIGRLTDKLEARYERASGEIAERIRRSEERTQRLLEEARTAIDRGLTRPEPKPGTRPEIRPEILAEIRQEIRPEISAEAGSEAAEPIAIEPVRAAAPAPAAAPPVQAIALNLPKPAIAHAPATPPEDMAFLASFAPERDESAETAEPPFPAFASTPAGGDFHAPDLDLEAMFAEPGRPAAPVQKGFDDDFAAETEFVDANELRARPPVSTKEAIEAARAAARLGVRNTGPDDQSGLFSGLKRGGKSRLQERVAKQAQPREGSTLKNALMASGVAAVLVTSGYGYLRLMRDDSDLKPPPGDLKIASREAPASDAEHAPLAAVAIAPSTPQSAPAPIGDQAQAVELYQAAVTKLGRGDKDGVGELSKAANLGYAPAQFFLASLYTNGDSGVRKDLAEARRWTERAALGGDRRAMFNLGMFFYEGSGGQADQSEAVKWFRKAADLGLVDSQYNLARLYEQGLGVARDPGEALKWYLIAARSGDEQSKEGAEQLKAQLSSSERASAEEAARRFRVAQAGPGTLAAR
jgi:localization factor PodJL